MSEWLHSVTGVLVLTVFRAQENLPAMFTVIFSELSRICGWSFSVVVGGSGVRSEGAIG